MTGSVLIVISSLAAEGTPRLALELGRSWLRLGLRPVIVVLHAQPDDLRADFDALRIERIDLNVSRQGYWRYVQLAFGIYRAARCYRAIAVLSMPLGWHSFMAIGARLAGVQRFVAHVGNHPNPSKGRAFTKFRTLVRLGRLMTSSHVCCSRYVQGGAVRHFNLDVTETSVIYNGVPLDDFARRAAVAGNARARHELFTIGMVARLEAHKDHATLIDAAKILKERGRHFRVLLIGDGSNRANLEARISDTGTADRVTLLGMRRDIPELVGGLDLFVFSTTPDEGMGIALVEAMAAEIPIVASDVGACREVLEDGLLGVLVTPGKPAALADAIEAIMASPLAALAQARDAKARATQDFSIDAMAERYAELLGLDASVTSCVHLEEAEYLR